MRAPMLLPVSEIAREPTLTRRVRFDACHALLSSGASVRRLYPKWYVGKNKVSA